MTVGDLHELASNLFVIEGHHPGRLWEDPDIPSIAVYRAGSTLYLLDTGVGLEQRRSILEVADRLGPVDELMVLNSHGHLDHLGNNDVIGEIPAGTKRHFLPREGRPALDSGAFFGAMYRRGIPYFDYLDGLRVDAVSMTSLLRAAGAAPTLTESDVAAVGALLTSAGIIPAIGKFIPGLLLDIILSSYPVTFPHLESARDFQDLGPAGDIAVADTTWSGWSMGDGAVHVVQIAGHSAGGCAFYIPEHSFMMFADETTTAPIWADSKPANTSQAAQRALTMMDSGHLEVIAAGHFPLMPQRGDDARRTLKGFVAAEQEFRNAVNDSIAGHPDGVCIDDLFHDVTTAAQPGSMVHRLWDVQFPVFATFLKLTLLNHCLLYEFEEGLDPKGRITFRLT